MKNTIQLVMFFLLFTSCSSDDVNKELLNRLEKLQAEVSKLSLVPKVSEAFFSSNVKYSCSGNECNDSVVLVAAKTEVGIQQCTGVMLTNSSLLISEKCFENYDINEKIKCTNYIEVKNLAGETAKCSEVKTFYKASLGEKLFIVELDRNIELDKYLVHRELDDENMKVSAYTIKNQEQIRGACEVSFVSILNESSINTNSEYLNVKECNIVESSVVMQGGFFLGLVTKKFKKLDFSVAVNSLCLFESCDKNKYTHKRRFLNAVFNSTKANRRALQGGMEPFDGQKYEVFKQTFLVGKDKLTVKADAENICVKGQSDFKTYGLEFSYSLNEFKEISVLEGFKMIKDEYRVTISNEDMFTILNGNKLDYIRFKKNLFSELRIRKCKRK